MSKVILFGATGNLGACVAHELVTQGFEVTCVVRSTGKVDRLPTQIRRVTADATKANDLAGITQGFDVVISCLGKSVSLSDRSKASFYDIDFTANSLILADGIRAKVGKFVYVSAFHAERYSHLEYFLVHHEFSERLKASGLNYSIVKPPALFSAFKEAADLARKGRLVNIGKGDRKTNPIYEGDLAKVIVSSIKQDHAVVEAGGMEILTRKQILEIIQEKVKPGKPLRTIPMGLVQKLLPLVKLLNRNQYDKLAFFLEVMQHDVVAPAVGEMRLKDYLTVPH